MTVLTDNEDFTAYIPDNLNECSLDQLLEIQRIKEEGLDKADIVVKFLQACIRDEHFEELVQLCNTSDLAEIALRVYDNFLNSNKFLDTQKIPFLTLRNKILDAPKDYIANICFGQFVEADKEYLLYFKTQNVMHLNKLVSILYRPRDEKIYDNEVNELHIKEIAKIELEIKTVINSYWTGCRLFLANRFKLVFPKTKSKEDDPLTFEKIKKSTQAYNSKMIQYAKTPDKKIDIYLENVYVVFEFIEHDLLEQMSIKSQQ